MWRVARHDAMTSRLVANTNVIVFGNNGCSWQHCCLYHIYNCSSLRVRTYTHVVTLQHSARAGCTQGHAELVLLRSISKTGPHTITCDSHAACGGSGYKVATAWQCSKLYAASLDVSLGFWPRMHLRLASASPKSSRETKTSLRETKKNRK